MIPIVSIVGRTNVGKSTLFNRLVGRRRSIVNDMPGVTRDRIISEALLKDRVVTYIDTGGLGYDPIDQISGAVGQQIKQAIADADVLLFVLDGKVGLTAQDQDVMDLIRPHGKKTIVVVNKVDPGTKESRSKESTLADFYQLGLENMIPVSAEHGAGIDQLQSKISSLLPDQKDGAFVEEEKGTVRVAFMGRPNVGKSSLINRILNEPRLIVSDQGGTTRDTVDTKLYFKDLPYTLLDTAGIRRKSKVEGRIEVFSVFRAMKSIRQAHVVALVLDAEENITTQDQRIANLVMQYGAGLMILVNKWDLYQDSKHLRQEFREELRYRAPFLNFADLRFVSAKEGIGIDTILPTARRITRFFHERIDQDRLKEQFQEILQSMPGTIQRVGLRLKSITQPFVGKPVKLVIRCNRPDLVTKDLEKYLLNRLYEKFGLDGIPVLLEFKV